MKKLFIISSSLFAVLIFIAGCKKNEIKYGEFTNITSSNALLKINYTSVYASNPAVQFKINKERVSPLITARTPYPGGGFNTGGLSNPDYLALYAGNPEFSISIPNKGTNLDSVALLSKTITLESGNSYTAHVTDTGANMKLLLLVDSIAKPDSGYAKFRFVHLMPNVAAIDLYFGTTVVAANIPYLTSSKYFTVAIPSSATAWFIREAGASPTSTALATYSSASTYNNQRVYTAFAMGYKGLTDVIRKPYISFLLNR
jgi:hypothetical protein